MHLDRADRVELAAEGVLFGGQPVVVESESDQHYLTAMKNYLVRRGLFRPTRDIVFLPAAHLSGARTLVDLVAVSNEPLPFAILDANAGGRQFALGLKDGLYAADQSRVLTVADFREIVDGEVEDLLPLSLLARVVDRFFTRPGGVDEDFETVAKEGLAFLPQVEDYARRNKILLEPAWKVDFAKRVKLTLLRATGDPLRGEPEYVNLWRRLFDTIHPTEVSPA